MELITRKIINSHFNLIVNRSNNATVLYTYSRLIDYINQAKTYYINVKGVKSGESVRLVVDTWPEFLIWFIAGSELGLNFIVIDPNAESSKKHVRLFGSINHIISYHDNYALCDTSHKDTFWATPSSILIRTLSSGSTGTPKVIKHTQKFLYDLAYRNVKIYQFMDTDRCLHLKPMIHSSVVGIYFLPSIIACSYHYYFYDTTVNWIDLTQKESISKMLLFRSDLENLEKYLVNQYDHQVEIFSIGFISDEFKSKVINNNVTVKSLFGCSETLGPIFWDEYSNDNKFIPERHFGKVFDDFYDVNIEDGMLVVTLPNGSTINTGDRFHLDSLGNYVFDGRDNRYSINNDDVNLDVLSEIVKDTIDVNFDLIADPSYNQIYIRTDEKINLQDLNNNILEKLKNQNYLITKQLVSTQARFMTDIKFNANAVRIACRDRV